MIRYTIRTPDRGATLIELITALAIVLIALTLAAPDVTGFIQYIRISSATNELHNAIMLARTAALSHNARVDLVALNDDWKNGWIMSGSDKKQIMTHEALHTDFKIEARFSDGLQHIAYNGTGHSVGASASTPQYGHIKLALGAHERLIIVNSLGRTRICNPSRDTYCETGSSE